MFHVPFVCENAGREAHRRSPNTTTARSVPGRIEHSPRTFQPRPLMPINNSGTRLPSTSGRLQSRGLGCSVDARGNTMSQHAPEPPAEPNAPDAARGSVTRLLEQVRAGEADALALVVSRYWGLLL